MVCTNLDDDQLSVEVLNTHLSDRTSQLTTLNILSEIKTLPQITCQNFSQENMNSLKQTLQNQSWDEIIQEENTETAYSKFLRTVTKSFDYACPYKRTRSRPANCKSAIFNAETHNLKKKFVEAQDRCILIGRQEDKADAVRKKKDYDLILRQLRQQANENQLFERPRAIDVQSVFTLQKWTVRMLAGLKPRESCRDAFRDLHILTVPSIFILEVILHAQKLVPRRHDSNNNYGTRNALDFNLPYHRTTLYSKKPTYAGARLFTLHMT
ncbi:hypothetical protein J6590_098885 [Homalodisca vitripennis]|nr:hypothetical protein J6590_098885 [Homalodisca vitripennis]